MGRRSKLHTGTRLVLESPRKTEYPQFRTSTITRDCGGVTGSICADPFRRRVDLTVGATTPWEAGP